jgi:hypothetical protein
MRQYDWIQVVGWVTVALSASAICVVLFVL